MFLTLNEIIKLLIVFLIIEVLLFFITSFFETTAPIKEPIEDYTLTVQSTPLKEVEMINDKVTTTFINSPTQSKLNTLNAIYTVKRTASPFRMVSLKTNEDVVSIKNQKVEPICYTNTIDLECLSIQKKKETFINMMIPSILLAKHKMKMERKKVLRLSNNSVLSKEDNFWLSEKLEKFKVSSTDELYKNMELHPTSLIIAQAIVESGWGTSKFFQKGNNVFGVWSFDKNEQRIVASEKRGNNSVYLKKYESIHESIYDYLLTLSHVSHYESFREKRLETQDPFTLIEHLEKYSEQGDVYIANIKNIMQKNKLLQYDSYELNL